MAFLLNWTCEDCGHIIKSRDEPEDEDCICYKEPYVETDPAFMPMERKECNARYKHQYMLNGYTWGNKQAWMYMGAVGKYPDRQVQLGEA